MEAGKATSDIKKFDAAIKEMPATTDKTTKALDGMVAKFIGVAAVIGIASKAFNAFKGFMEDSVKAAMEQENADRSLASALELTGRAIPLESMKNFASALQRQTTFGDEAIQGVQTLLVQMTKLDREGLDKATKGAIGLASVMKMDLQSAAMLVQKAMTGNVGALSRYGIQVDESLSQGEKQAELMEKLSGLYQRAIADADTFEGKIKQLKNSFGDFQENVGNAVVKSTELNEVLSLIKVTMDQFGEATSTSLGPIGAFGAVVAVIADQIKMRLGPALAVLAFEQAKANAEARKISEAYDRGDELWTRMGWIVPKAAAAVEHFGKIAFDKTKPVNLLAQNVEDLAEAFSILDTPIDWENFFPPEREFPNPLQDIIDSLVFINKIEPTWTEKWTAAMATFKQASDQVFASFNEVAAQAQTNREIEIDNEYKMRLDYINRTITDETAKQQAITALEAEYEIKRSASRRAGAKAAKAVAFMEAIVNTASGVSRALKDFPFPLSAIIAGIVGALGAVQVALIAKQPIPLAKGFEGIVRKPTTFLAGEAGPEYLSVRPMGQAGGGGLSVTINGPMVATSAALTQEMCQRAASWMFTAIESEAQRRGRRLAWQK